MIRGLLILVAALFLGAGGYLAATRHAAKPSSTETNELAWLKTDFNLSDEEFARINALHQEYLPRCEEMCDNIRREHQKLQTLISNTNVVTPEIEATLKEISNLRVECQTMMLQHFYQVSKHMPPEQGKRYLAQMQQQTTLLSSQARTH